MIYLLKFSLIYYYFLSTYYCFLQRILYKTLVLYNSFFFFKNLIIMGKDRLDNVAPKIYDVKERGYTKILQKLALSDDEPITAEEVFEYIRYVKY